MQCCLEAAAEFAYAKAVSQVKKVLFVCFSVDPSVPVLFILTPLALFVFLGAGSEMQAHSQTLLYGEAALPDRHGRVQARERPSAEYNLLSAQGSQVSTAPARQMLGFRTESCVNLELCVSQ